MINPPTHYYRGLPIYTPQDTLSVNEKDFGTLEELYELVTKAAQGTGGKVRAIIMTAPAFDRYKELLGEPPEKAKAKDAKA